jgi:precorrin-6B methylase 2
MSDTPSVNAPVPASAQAPSPALFFETINAFQRSAALKAAVDLKLFTALGSGGGPTHAADLAARCLCPERGIRILADTLTILGFLTKTDGVYTLTPDSALFLDGASPAYLGSSVDFLYAPSIADVFGHLSETVRSGAVHGAAEGTTAADHPVWTEFARTMGPMMRGHAQLTAALVPLDPKTPTKVLDISASHGVFGIAFAERSANSHLVALDWEAVLDITEQNALAAGLEGRFSKIAGDAFTVDLGTGYDVVLIPNFLHHFSIAACTGLLRRVQAALRPGGRVVIVDFVPNEDRITPPPAAGFSLVMLGTTPEGDAYTFAEYRQMLLDAGFQEPTLHPLPPMAQSAVIAAV